MNEEIYLAMQNRYYTIVAKMAQLETQIKNTVCPTCQGLLRTDYRDLEIEKKQIMEDLIDVKP